MSGVRLGNPNGPLKLVAGAGTKKAIEAAERFASDRLPMIERWDEGLSLRAIAARLNEDGIRTRRGHWRSGESNPVGDAREVARV